MAKRRSRNWKVRKRCFWPFVSGKARVCKGGSQEQSRQSRKDGIVELLFQGSDTVRERGIRFGCLLLAIFLISRFSRTCCCVVVVVSRGRMPLRFATVAFRVASSFWSKLFEVTRLETVTSSFSWQFYSSLTIWERVWKFSWCKIQEFGVVFRVVDILVWRGTGGVGSGSFEA